MIFGSPCTYLSHNQSVITWVSNYRYKVSNLNLFVTGYVMEYTHGWHVNYTHFNAFFHNVPYSFHNL